MQLPVTTRTALLQVLRDGPGYGAALIQRLERLTGGAIRLSPARVYPVLKELEGEGLVAAQCVRPKGKRGARARTYYDLTSEGIERSAAVRSLLHTLLAGKALPPPDARERRLMAARLLEMEEVSAAGEETKAAMSRSLGHGRQ